MPERDRLLNPVGGRQLFIVPVLNFNVRTEIAPAGPARNIEFTQTELEGYYISADEAMSGPNNVHKMSFAEAIRMFIV